MFKFEKVINAIICIYIFSLYLFTYREGLNVISNAIALVLVFFIWMNFLIEKKKLIFNKLLYMQVLFILICTLSLFYAIDKDIALTKIKTLILIFIVMISLVNYIDTMGKIEKVIKYFIYSGVITSFYVLINSDFSQITRFGGELGNVNDIGMNIALSSTFCVYIILAQKKYSYTLFLLIMIPTILLTGSRKALIFILISVLLILFLRNKNSFKNIFQISIVIALIFAIAYYPIFKIPLFYQTIGVRVENLFSFLSGAGTNEASLNIRLYMTEFGLHVFKAKPLLGYGIDNYKVLYGLNSGMQTYAHNNYIELMVDIGILGVTTYYLTQIIVLRELFYASKEIKNKTICYAFTAIVVLYITLSSSLVYYDSKHFSILLAITNVISRIVKLDNKISKDVQIKYYKKDLVNSSS